MSQKMTRTNADRIRAMTDEELAAVIACPNEVGLAEIECDQSNNCRCEDCCLSWLRASQSSPQIAADNC